MKNIQELRQAIPLRGADGCENLIKEKFITVRQKLRDFPLSKWWKKYLNQFTLKLSYRISIINRPSWHHFSTNPLPRKIKISAVSVRSRMISFEIKHNISVERTSLFTIPIAYIGLSTESALYVIADWKRQPRGRNHWTDRRSSEISAPIEPLRFVIMKST